MDRELSAQPLYLQLIATMPVAAFLVEYVAAMMGQPAFDIPHGDRRRRPGRGVFVAGG